MSGETRRRPSVPGEQRVFSLVLALVASPQGATKRELLDSVYGYSERPRGGTAEAALDRLFERDKTQLRELGIPIDTLDSPLEPGNNQLTRYRISKDLLQMPAELRFTERELSFLRAAALAWREGSLTAESRRATMKLESLGVGLDVQYLGVAPHLGLDDPAAPPLQRAIDEGLVARFSYQLPDRDEPLTRLVAPLRLHRADGRWHLIAHDLERQAPRVFLLSRITSAVRTGPENFDTGLRSELDAVLEELLAREQSLRARVRVHAGSLAEARFAARSVVRVSDRQAQTYEFGTLDFAALAGELASFGDQLVVESPSELREGTVALLRQIRDQHSSDAPRESTNG